MWQRFNRFNDWFAAHAVSVFGSSLTFYLFFLYGFLPLMFPNQEVSILYWSNSVQLWSLPLIMVGTNVLGRATEAQAKRQYAMVQQITDLTRQIHTMMVAMDHVVEAVLDISELNRDALTTIAAKTHEIDAEIDAMTAKGENL